MTPEIRPTPRMAPNSVSANPASSVSVTYSPKSLFGERM